MPRCAAFALIRALPALVPALIPLACAPLSGLSGAELVLRDLGGQVVVLPTAFTFTSSSTGYSTSGSDSFRSGSGLELGGRYAYVPAGSSLGAVAGLDLTSQWYTYAGGEGLTTYGLRPSLGIGWAPLDRLTLVAEGGVSAGSARFALPASTSAPAFSSAGTSFGYDARLSARWAISERWRLQATLGYLISTTKLSGGGVDFTLDQRGSYIALGVTWQLSTRPTRLE